MAFSEPPIWMDQDFRVSINPLIELLVGYFGIIYAYLVGDNETRLGLPSDDEVAEVSVVFLDVALASSQLEPL